MSVITKYVVVREGVEKMVFTTKKEADLYDKLLDIADDLTEFLQKAEGVNLKEEQYEKIAFFLATNKDELQKIVKGGVKKVQDALEIED